MSYDLTQQLADERLGLEGLKVVDVLPRANEDDRAPGGSHSAQVPGGGVEEKSPTEATPEKNKTGKSQPAKQGQLLTR